MERKLAAAGFEFRFHAIEGFMDDADKIGGLGAESQVTGHDTRMIQKVFGQLEHPRALDVRFFDHHEDVLDTVELSRPGVRSLSS